MWEGVEEDGVECGLVEGGGPVQGGHTIEQPPAVEKVRGTWRVWGGRG